jgi:hypothetical protein
MTIGPSATCRPPWWMSAFEVQSGKYMLALSSSQFAPTQTLEKAG